MKKIVQQWLEEQLPHFHLTFNNDESIRVENSSFWFEWMKERLSVAINKKPKEIDCEDFYLELGKVYNTMHEAFKMNKRLEVTRNE